MLSFYTYSRNEPLGPLSIVHSVGRDEAHFALSHQFSLGRRGRFHQRAGGCRDRLGCLQDLLFEVQRLVRLLRRKETQELERLILRGQSLIMTSRDFFFLNHNS